MTLRAGIHVLIGSSILAMSSGLSRAQSPWQESFRVAADSLEHLQATSQRWERSAMGPWYVIGPFKSNQHDPFREAFPPEQGVDLARHYGALKWMKRSDWHSGRVTDLLPATWCAAYLIRTVTVRHDTLLTVFLGSDDGIKLWVNKKLVLADSAFRGCAPNQDTAYVRLKKGTNTLLMKITNGEGPTAFYFSLVGPTREGLWVRMQEEYSAPEELREMSWEQTDSVWAPAWKPGDFAELADRYRRAYLRTAAEIGVQPETFPTVRNAADLARVREIYLHARRQEYEALAHLTPKERPEPKINGPAVFGVRPEHSFLYRIPATGERPMTFSAHGLPAGLALDSTDGIIQGAVAARGEYKIVLKAANTRGSAFKNFTVIVGDRIALTPPLGWNSWNCFATAVDQDKVRAAAASLVKSGLANHGWTYINIDDTWEVRPGSLEPLTRGVPRDTQGRINTNAKFPDMRGLADFVHHLGLKLGIYSSPGPLTCAGYTGSYQHELDDARQYAEWGIDYLKYDWCSYGDITHDTSLAGYEHPYRVMRAALDSVNRDIVYSLCQYGMKNVWEWGNSVGGNCWRTTGDITDTWQSMSSIGFNQNGHEPFAGPGHWNDPDMLVVGWVGWGPQLHPTRLTPEEQITHITLWSILAAPLLIGCDLTRLDDFTYGLLSNDEVLAVDQDELGVQGRRIVKQGDGEIWVKPLHDGSLAVGLFNRGPRKISLTVDWRELGVKGPCTVRDLWRQNDLGVFPERYSTAVGRHGAALLRVSETHAQ